MQTIAQFECLMGNENDMYINSCNTLAAVKTLLTLRGRAHPLSFDGKKHETHAINSQGQWPTAVVSTYSSLSHDLEFGVPDRIMLS